MCGDRPPTAGIGGGRATPEDLIVDGNMILSFYFFKLNVFVFWKTLSFPFGITISLIF
jgi:hypothetical protein